MGPRRRLDRRPIAGACTLILVGCNLISGAESLKLGSDDDIPLRERGRATDEEQLDAGRSRSSSGGSGGSTSSEERGSGANDASASESPDASFDATTGLPAGFSDPFERPDGPTIGNDWFEKKDVFRVSSGAVVQDGVGFYYNQFVRRPYSESVRDVQIELDFTLGAHERIDPTLFARIQPGSDEHDILTCYTFYAYPDFAGIDREDGDKRSELTESDLTQPLVAGQTYHFVFRVRGTDPVELDGAITTTTGKLVTTVSAVDHSSRRITAAGPIAFGSGKGDRARWDNVVRTDL